MGERFYLSQLKATGTCPGSNLKKRRKKVAWTDEKRETVLTMWEEAEPTPETSVEIVKSIAEDLDETPNGVRMVLTKAGVYIKKAGSKSSTSDKPKRVSKEDAQAALSDAIADAGQEVDADIISKLTGKAAVYFKGVIQAINS